MPSVNLTLRQTAVPSATSGAASYSVTNTVVSSVGISPAVFVFKTETGKFDHYATPPDMDSLPASREEAVVAGLGFYRQSAVQRVWPTISAMNEDLAVTRARLAGLAREVSKIQGALTIDQTVEIQAG